MPEEIKKGQEEQVQDEQAKTEEQVEEVSASEEPTEEQAQEQPEKEAKEPELPEDAKERTRKEFEKLKKHNAELKRQLEEREQLPSVLEYPGLGVPRVNQEVKQKYQQPQGMQMPQFNFPYQQQVQQDNQPEEKLVDEQGYVNAKVLESQLKQAEDARRKAEEAERRAVEAQQRIARFEQDAETKELYKQYPELDPLSETFDREAYDLVKNELTSQIVNTGKRDAVKAAQRMEKYFRKPAPSNQKVLEQRKAVTSASGTQPRQTNTDLEELRLRSRTDPKAVAERLRRLGM